jgi:hypothetical protein
MTRAFPLGVEINNAGLRSSRFSGNEAAMKRFASLV